MTLVLKEAWIKLNQKEGRKDDCFNYRCIAVTSTMSRLYGKVLQSLLK